jgi:NADPH:quinone reductase-like Zn-dependent oxidoreductase
MNKKMNSNKMKAIVYTKYGPPDVLELKEVEIPTPKDNEVLIKVHAASVNYSDWAFVRGKPFLVRLLQGMFKPKNNILGADISGRVETVGSDVTQFQLGDEVYADLSGNGWSGFAEYASVPEKVLALKPVNTTFEEAAAIPQAALVALQGLRNKGKIQSGQKVLINGASGGIGSFAVQIAKSFGAEVTGVCSSRNLDILHSIGADHVIDYTQEDITKSDQRYDLILDIAAYRSILEYKSVLNPNGIYILAGGSLTRILQASIIGGKKITNFMAELNQKDLILMKELVEAGKVIPIIDRRYPLNEVAEAVRYYGKGHSRGKVVIKIKESKI